MRPDSSKVNLCSSTLEYCNALELFYRNYTNSSGNSFELNRKSTRTVRPVELVRVTQICESLLFWHFQRQTVNLCATRTHALTMGNSVSPGFGTSANHGLRDVGSAEPCREVERPAEHLEEANRKSQIQLPVRQKSYKCITA